MLALLAICHSALTRESFAFYKLAPLSRVDSRGKEANGMEMRAANETTGSMDRHLWSNTRPVRTQLEVPGTAVTTVQWRRTAALGLVLLWVSFAAAQSPGAAYPPSYRFDGSQVDPPSRLPPWGLQEEMVLEDELDATAWQLPPVSEPPALPEPAEKRRSRGSGMGGGPFGGSGGPGYGAMWFPPQPVTGQDVNFQLVQQNAAAMGPVWKGDHGIALLSLKVRNSHYFTDAILPNTQRAFPSNLWDVGLGLTYFHKFDGGSTLGIISGFGSESDRPFHSIDEMNVSLVTFLRKPTQNGRDAWMFGAMYSSSGTLNFPIPIIAYEWNPNERFKMNIGLPFSLEWKPRDDWTLNVTYLPLTNGNVLITKDLTERLHLYGGYRSVSDAYFLSDRVKKEERFFSVDQRVLLGLRWDLGEHFVVDFSSGYVFDRRYGEGENQGATWHDEVSVEPGAFIGLDCRLQF